MSKSQALAGVGKALSHISNDPDLTYKIQIIAIVLIIVIILYEVGKWLESQ